MKLSIIKKSKLFWFLSLYVGSLVVVGGFMLIVHLIPPAIMLVAK